jgi:hypothetical protein
MPPFLYGGGRGSKSIARWNSSQHGKNDRRIETAWASLVGAAVCPANSPAKLAVLFYFEFSNRSESEGDNMPFIGGRYHINPIAGEALEAAREAEAALLALQEKARQNSNDEEDSYGASSSGNSGNADGDFTGDQNGAASAATGPIHRVEIDAAELVPSHSGRAQRGFVARVHRNIIASGAQNRAGSGALPSKSPSSPLFASRGVAPGNGGARTGVGGIATRPETHVFSDHHDLVDFLRGEFAKDARARRS